MTITKKVRAIREVGRLRASLPDHERCQQIREAAHVSRRELADALGVPAQVLWDWESGRRAVPKHRQAGYAEALRILSEPAP